MTHSRDPIRAPLHLLMKFSQSIQVRRMMQEIVKEPKQNFWVMTTNLLMESAANEWCKVFGSDDQDTHWKCVIPNERHDEIRAGLLKATGLTLEDWKKYREHIVTYRDKMIAHHDLDVQMANFPHYDVAILAANFMFDSLEYFASDGLLGDIPQSLDRWSQSVARNMKPIVTKAFEASATLGSNIKN